MSLLHQNSRDLDDAARGEELTKGTSHVVWAAVIATILVTIAIAVYVIAGEKPPAATAAVEQVWAHPMHSESSGSDANGVAIAKEHFDQVLVFTLVKLHNQSKQPLFLHQILVNATLDDGIHSSYAATAVDYNRIFVAYPALAPLQGKALAPDTTLEPGETAEGTFVCAFRITKQQWDARKGLSFTFAFRYQPDLVVAFQSPVREQ